MSTTSPTDGADQSYQGFEQGPIRPPSEAHSLLLRVMRNCPWNRCKFCPVYKGTEFSTRPVAHVIRDIEAVYAGVQALTKFSPGSGNRLAASAPILPVPPADRQAWQAARHWLRYGCRAVFLQDANSLCLPPADLITILRHLRSRFPEVQRITCYARSTTVAKMADEDLAAIREAGLNRVHIGMESGADQVLKMVHKGTTQKRQIMAGVKIKQAGMELSEYYMPGLGGRNLWELNATATAAALNAINPDFIRIRTLALPYETILYDDYRKGNFEKCTDVMMAQELLLFLESLRGITSKITNDHILNLLPEMEGKLPQDRERLINVVKAFLALEPPRQFLYQVGRRLGYFSRLSDLHDEIRVEPVEEFCRLKGVTPDNLEEVTAELMRRFI